MLAQGKPPSPLTYTPQPREYTATIEAAYRSASGVLLKHLMGTLQLKQRLMSLKRFFLLDQGDFLVHFLDLAHGELSKGKTPPERPLRRLFLSVKSRHWMLP